MDDFTLASVTGLLTTYGMSVLGGIVILVVGWIVAGWASRWTGRAVGRVKNVDAMLAGFLGSLVKYVILAVTVLAVLSRFGVQTASLIAIFGAAGLALGLALQGTLSQLAAGVMLLLFRPFKVGDYIDTGGAAGSVKAVGLFTTELATPDNVQIIVPNGDVWGSTVHNYSFHPTRRVDYLLGIGYGDSIDKAMQAITDVIAADARCHTDPAPQIVVGELADSAVNIIVRVWADAGDYWGLKFDLTKRFKEAFDTNGISIPFPQRDVHLHQTGA